MSNFTPKVSFSTEFDGDTVTMELSRFRRGDILKLVPYMMEMDDGSMSMSVDDQTKFVEVMASILPERVSKWNGLKASDGTPISLEQAIEEMYFQPLIGAVLGQLFFISKPSEESLKNLQAESVGISKSDNFVKTEPSADSAIQNG